MKCAHEGCQKEASCAPKICVPAVNGPLEESKTIGLILSLKICQLHFDELKIKDFLSPTSDLRRMVEIVARGKAEPDFERAWFKRVLLISNEFGMFERAQAGRPGGG